MVVNKIIAILIPSGLDILRTKKRWHREEHSTV